MRIVCAMNDEIREFIRACGGPTKVAALTGATLSTVSSWSKRKSIPIEHWQAFVDAGVDIEQLWKLHRHVRRKVTRPTHSMRQAAE